MDDVERVLAGQVRYYDARAGEYDDDMWNPERADDQLATEMAQLEAWVKSLPLVGRVVELGCGTGRWTPVLARRADTVIAVDPAPRMLAAAHARLGNTPNVKLVRADALQWVAEPPADLVFFSFLLSHIPPQRFEHFWSQVRSSLRAGGIAAFVDAAPAEAVHEDALTDDPVPLVQRRLRDGSEHQIVKVFHTLAALKATLGAIGWDAEVEAIGRTFIVGAARPMFAQYS